ncbi:hypothetical protein DFH29DRAFT_874637 [Suillus ampliporus]|nr:hypothetical protein DFH29DRAFT_874637 [Suillus ampliporus]
MTLGSPNNGLYSVSLDSGHATQYNVNIYGAFYEVVSYHADNLGSGRHQLTLTNLPGANELTQELDIDYALLTSSISSLGFSATSGVSSSIVYVTSKGLSSRAVSGIAVAAVMALSALAAAFFYRRWKLVQEASQNLYRINTPQTPVANANTDVSSSVETSNT